MVSAIAMKPPGLPAETWAQSEIERRSGKPKLKGFESNPIRGQLQAAHCTARAAEGRRSEAQPSVLSKTALRSYNMPRAQ